MKLPPYAELLGLSVAGDEAGAPLLLMPFSVGVMGRPGFLHGGAIGGLLEMAAFCARARRWGWVPAAAGASGWGGGGGRERRPPEQPERPCRRSPFARAGGGGSSVSPPRPARSR
jgi:hypothetical protein